MMVVAEKWWQRYFFMRKKCFEAWRQKGAVRFLVFSMARTSHFQQVFFFLKRRELAIGFLKRKRARAYSF
jgi:hypothetical protein